jgi:hypothetical protein
MSSKKPFDTLPVAGHIREMQNVVEREVILSRGRRRFRSRWEASFVVSCWVSTRVSQEPHMTSTTALPLPTISPQVRAFAVEKGVEPFLPALVAAARRIFPEAHIQVLVQDDPELSDNRQIAFEVDDNGRSPAEQVAGHHQWAEELLRRCPATHVHAFCLIQGPPT